MISTLINPHCELGENPLWNPADASLCCIPDGLTVDRDGNIWSARWDGFAVVQHAPDGRMQRKFPFPVAKVSSLCFGGPSLDEIFVTTAGGQPGSDTADGSVYHWRANVKGSPEFRSRILIRTV